MVSTFTASLNHRHAYGPGAALLCSLLIGSPEKTIDVDCVKKNFGQSLFDLIVERWEDTKDVYQHRKRRIADDARYTA